VLSWGADWADQLGTTASPANDCDCSDIPVYVSPPSGMSSLPDVAAVSANGNQSIILTTDGVAYSWGTSATTTDSVTTNYGLGNGAATGETLPTPLTLPSGTTIATIGTGEYFGLAIVGSSPDA